MENQLLPSGESARSRFARSQFTSGWISEWSSTTRQRQISCVEESDWESVRLHHTVMVPPPIIEQSEPLQPHAWKCQFGLFLMSSTLPEDQHFAFTMTLRSNLSIFKLVVHFQQNRKVWGMKAILQNKAVGHFTRRGPFIFYFFFKAQFDCC